LEAKAKRQAERQAAWEAKEDERVKSFEEAALLGLDLPEE